MDHILGTCSLCGGPVSTPVAWAGTNPPRPTCQQCGAVADPAFGPVIKMTPLDPEYRKEMAEAQEELNAWIRGGGLK
jgi:hypothetical protein